jgi:2-dehydro-3-deoxygluconokinase
MSLLNILPKDDRTWDVVALGEILLRFDPGNERIQTTRAFQVYGGGAEYNVARTLSDVFGRKAAIVTSLVANPLGRLAENMARQAAVDTSEIIWRDPDGSGDEVRNGIYFIERGFGVRAPASCFDRGYTAASRLGRGDVDWQQIFKTRGTRWFHTGGVFSGLSSDSGNLAAEAMTAAREAGAVVSYDLNYRDSIWKKKGGRPAADELNRKLLPHADVVFGILEFNPMLSEFDEHEFRRAAEKMTGEFSNLKMIASTLRNVHSASRHDLSAAAFADGDVFKGKDYRNIDVFDRVGSGDAFAAGVIFGSIEERGVGYSVECGLANAVLTMTTPGDNSSATLSEIERLMGGDNGSVDR